MRVGLGVALGGVVLAVEAGAVQVGWAWGMGQGGASREDISCEDTKPSCLTGVGARALARRGVRGRTWSWTASSVALRELRVQVCRAVTRQATRFCISSHEISSSSMVHGPPL